ncbi:MAG: helix-hairpin-helix domain-containing protein, partial [Verrucomicrobiota bacterium]
MVGEGLARAFGVSRQCFDGRSRDEFRAGLSDLELLAAQQSIGVWSQTDWAGLIDQRRQQRMEDEELALATGNRNLNEGEVIDINTAARDRLMQLPRIGEMLANRIIEARPIK